MFSILHISDLHRSEEWKVNNEALLNSLLQDRLSYTTKENPIIKTPNIIVVSGDMINGSSKQNFDEALGDIKKQYEEAKEFLNQLADKFVDGDKNRIILIPGNHDVCFGYSKRSMKKIDFSSSKMEEKDKVIRNLFNRDSKIRWSWKEQSFYEIDDMDLYSKRLEPYSKFYSEFYEGKRSFPLTPDEQFDFFDIEEFNITFFTFNSCHNNDHLNFAGYICPDSIARAYPKIQEFKAKGRILVAVWHHNTKGAPLEFNYMDGEVLKNFIDYGFVLGFHGHQHQSEIVEEILKFESKDNLFVVSSGTLCAGPPQLPTGINRQYNILEIDRTTLKINLHSRQMMQNVNFSLPIWQQGRIHNSLRSHVSFSLNASNRQSVTELQNGIVELIATKDYEVALEKLSQFDFSDPFIRNASLECHIGLNRLTEHIIDYFPPRNEKEIIYLLDACWEKKDEEKIMELIRISDEKYPSSVTLSALRTKYIKLISYERN